MRALPGALALSIILTFGGCRTGVGDTAPDFTLIDTGGRPHSLSDYDGQVRVLEFWATWCAPCQTVSPHMQSIHDRFADEPVKVLAVHYNEVGDPAAYVRKHGYTYTTLVNGFDVAKAYGVSKIPTILIVGRDGRVVYRRTGFSIGDERTIKKAIESGL